VFFVSQDLFARIISREIPATILYEDEQCLVFEDIQPQAPTHFLVIPKQAIARLSDAEVDDKPLLGHLMWVAQRIAKEQNIKDFRLVVNNGAGAGQSVDRLHLHLLGGRPMRWPPG
jgi:histidine triad (HIT) family protein